MGHKQEYQKISDRIKNIHFHIGNLENTLKADLNEHQREMIENQISNLIGEAENLEEELEEIRVAACQDRSDRRNFGPDDHGGD